MYSYDIARFLGKQICVSESPLEVHFNKDDFQGYIEADAEIGPWRVVLLGDSKVSKDLNNISELSHIMDNLNKI